MDFVGVDIGASNTRYCSNTGNIGVIPNCMVFVGASDDIRLEPYSNTIESSLDVTINKEGGDNPSNILKYPCRVLAGELADRHSPVLDRPSAMMNKHKQELNYVSILLAAAVAKLKDNLGEDIVLYLALPPVEAKSAADFVKTNLVGKYTINMTKYNKGTTVKLNVTDVVCYEESFLALIAYFFNMDGSPKQTAMEYAKGNVMSMNIGQSTSDFAIASNLRYLEKSGQTYKTGGNVAKNVLANHIRTVYGFDMTDEQLDMAMMEGRLQVGNDYIELSEAINNAKKEMAEQVSVQIQNYFRAINIPIQNIRAIVVSGGGSMRSEYIDDNGQLKVTSDPASKFITDKLSMVCPGVRVIPYEDNPRLADIKGLFIRAMLDMTKKGLINTNKSKDVENL